MSTRALWPWILVGFVIAALVLVAAEQYRAVAVTSQPLLPVSFEHLDHKETQCADCHHNFLDESGGGTCYNCHKYMPQIASDIEEIFHDFCFDCHVTTRGEGKDSGPMRECAGCHKPETMQ